MRTRKRKVEEAPSKPEPEKPVNRRRAARPQTSSASVIDRFKAFAEEPDGVYLYLLLPPGNRDEFDRMHKLIQVAEIPCEYSEAPSGWRCYRVKTADQDKLIPMPPDIGKWQSNFGIPAGYTYGMWNKRERVWRLSTICVTPCLYKTWIPVYAPPRARVKQEERPAATRRRRRNG